MTTLINITIPDIGGFTDVDVIEVMVKPGDRVGVEQSLITIESDKAAMEVPSPQAGVIKELKVKLGDKVSEGSPIVVLETDESTGALAESKTPPPALKSESAVRAPHQQSVAPAAKASGPAPQPSPETAAIDSPPEVFVSGASKPHASPSVRKFARELGVDLNRIKGSGRHRRIFRSDVEKFVKTVLSSPAAPAARNGTGAALDLLPWPKVDFKRFGEIEAKPLSRVRKLSKANLARNWVMIPHVTQLDEADVTELEAFRQELNAAQSKDGIRVTMLAFILKALVAALAEFPEFNSSLDGDNLILKKYFHIGFAADTPDGLVVPVVRDVDQKGVLRIARETAELAASARAGKLRLTEIQGGCMTVSSLGGIGGTAFTPIINAPEVAILGVSKHAHQPVYRGGAFVPRLMLPPSLSYDHRVIDGAAAARFITYLSSVLADMRRALL
ncbi:MAG: dihydrolipoyllysine-residue acetyltransferase [Candidatus Binataceae bacterium]